MNHRYVLVTETSQSRGLTSLKNAEKAAKNWIGLCPVYLEVEIHKDGKSLGFMFPSGDGSIKFIEADV